jgi:lipid-binding SYLF domain-containing protein
MKTRDPGVTSLLDSAVGYAVFLGYRQGRGRRRARRTAAVLFEHGQPSGYIELNQGSIGAQLGAQTFSELIVFHDQFALERFSHAKALEVA